MDEKNIEKYKKFETTAEPSKAALAASKKVLDEIRGLSENRWFELLFPLQYLEIKIDKIRETKLDELIERCLKSKPKS